MLPDVVVVVMNSSNDYHHLLSVLSCMPGTVLMCLCVHVQFNLIISYIDKLDTLSPHFIDVETED